MRALVILVAAVIGEAAGACMGSDRGAQTTVTSGSQSPPMTGTGATGGSTPETDMQGTGRSSGVVVVTSEVAPPPAELPTTVSPHAVDASAPE